MHRDWFYGFIEWSINRLSYLDWNQINRFAVDAV
jgi:hypothetical protein